MNIKTIGIAVIGASVLALEASNPARAAQFNLSYTASGQENVNFNGLVTADEQGGGQFLITALTGKRNGIDIDSLLGLTAFGDNDNLFFPFKSVPATFRGFSFQLVNGTKINFADLSSGKSTSNFGESLDGFTLANRVSSFSVTPVSTAVPTPALLPGLIGMGIAAFRKRKGKGLSNPVRLN